METWEAITSRRNVRTYTDETIPKASLERILEAARRTPSSMNLQRWDFIVVTDRSQLARLSHVWRHAGHVAGSAATVALIAPDDPDPSTRESIHYDLGQATMAMALAATDLGVGTGHAAVSDQDLARQVLGHPDTYFCAWLIALGYPADRPIRPVKRPTRRPFDEVVHNGAW